MVGTDVHEREANANALRMLDGTGSWTVPELPEHTTVPSRTEGLPSFVRRPIESLIGFDFGSVRIHTGCAAAEQTWQQRADAFTRGRDVYFGPGRYRLDHPLGQALIAHELTHVAQQRAVPENPVVAHLRSLESGEPSDPSLYRRAMGDRLGRHDSPAVERGIALMSERNAPRSPSPAPQLDGDPALGGSATLRWTEAETLVYLRSAGSHTSIGELYDDDGRRSMHVEAPGLSLSPTSEFLAALPTSGSPLAEDRSLRVFELRRGALVAQAGTDQAFRDVAELRWSPGVLEFTYEDLDGKQRIGRLELPASTWPDVPR